MAKDDELDWWTIPSFTNYQVTSTGLVRSKSNGLLKPYENPYGYITVNLRKEGESYCKRLHRLVLEAFVGEAPKGFGGCHNDGDKLNNDLSNLRWDNQKGNYADAVKHGTAPNGETHGRAKLNEDKVRQIREKLEVGVSQYKLADEYGVDQSLISLIKKGKIWTTQ